MAYRRGFKTEANWYAKSVRAELRLESHSPLCPWALAELLGFPVIALKDFQPFIPKEVAFFWTANGQKAFSAVTLFSGPTRMIIHNDSHNRKRQAANIAHELAHGLLLHPPKPPFNKEGSRHYDKDLEDEANWLGPALLISDEAALHIAERKLAVEEASDIYGASIDVVRMRLNVSGAAIRVARRRAA